jgi:hypothetical protein
MTRKRSTTRPGDLPPRLPKSPPSRQEIIDNAENAFFRKTGLTPHIAFTAEEYEAANRGEVLEWKDGDPRKTEYALAARKRRGATVGGDR